MSININTCIILFNLEGFMSLESYSLSEYCGQQNYAVPDPEDHQHILALNEKQNRPGINDSMEDSIDRIKEAVYIHPEIRPIDLETVGRSELEAIARRTNAATLHFSGNCSLLAHAVAYNIEWGREVFCIKNTSPFFIGFSETTVLTTLQKHGSHLVGSYKDSDVSFQEIEDAILQNYELTGKRIFIVNTIHKSLFGLTSNGHSLNAVILKENGGSPKVVFLDAWYPSKPTLTSKELDEKYKLKSADIRSLRDKAVLL